MGKRKAVEERSEGSVLSMLPDYDDLKAKRAQLLAEVHNVELLMHAIEQMAEASGDVANVVYGPPVPEDL